MADDEDENDHDKEAGDAPQQRRSRNGNGYNNASRSPLGGWDGSSRTLEAARAEGVRRHDAAARRERALAYASGYQQQWQRQEEEKGGGFGFHWLERWMASQAQHHAPEPDNKNRTAVAAAAMTSYVTATDGGISERTIEMDASFRSLLNPSVTAQGRPPVVRGYMAATQSARAKTRTAPSATPTHVRSQSGAGLGGDTSSSGQSGGGGAHGQEPCAGYSPESSCTGDWTPPRFAIGGRTSRLAYS